MFLFLTLPISAKGEETLPRALFVSMIENTSVLSNRDGMAQLIDFAKKASIKILFVQIYRADQALFPSKIADTTPYEVYLKNISEDPFALLIKQAHTAGIEVHAWLNLLSLSTNKDAPMLKKYGPEILTKNLKDKKTLKDYRIDGQYFLEPGDLRVRQELAGIVEEVVRTYPDLDGIQFDYIRYPDVKPSYGFTKANVERFKTATGLKIIEEKSQAWKDWKRTQVTELLELLAQKARALQPHIKVSTTGCMPYIRAYDEAFQDWLSWLDGGLVDFVTMMNYSPDPGEFQKWISAIKGKTENFKKINISIGAYKFLHTPEVFKKELELCEQAEGGVCSIFYYGNLLESPALSNLLIKN
jgi:uncharacterized lipoprotein YddW (UPF0748 family)